MNALVGARKNRLLFSDGNRWKVVWREEHVREGGVATTILFFRLLTLSLM